jgi:hypothetical protein
MPLTDRQIVMGLVIVLAVWYVVGTWYNRRRGIRTLTWLRDGLASLGGRVEMSWIGSAASGAKAALNKPNPPFRQLNAVFLLESRELLPLWLANRLRGKRGELILKADFRAHRQGDVEVVPRGGRLERALRREETPAWQWEAGPHDLSIAYRGPQGKSLSTSTLSFLEDYGPYLYRFSWRRDRPNLLLHMRLAGLTDRAAPDVFDALARVFGSPND